MRLLVACALVGSCASAVAQGDLSQVPWVLRKAITASGTLRYTGQRVVQVRFEGDRREHTEFVSRDREKQRLEFGSDSPLYGQIIVEDGQNRYHYYPDKNEIRILPPRYDEVRHRLMMTIKRAAKNGLSFQTSLGGRVAGLETKLVSLTDSNGNSSQKLWIDEKTGLVLKREILDRSGTRVGYFEYRRVNYDPKFVAADFKLEIRGVKKVRPEDLVRNLAKENGMSVVFLPRSSGFRLESGRVLKRIQPPVLVLTYTSPQGQISFFQLDSPISEDRLRKFSGGEYAVYSWRRNGKSFALVGDIDPGALRAIGRKLGGN